MNTKHHITATIQFEKQFWVGIFERQCNDELAVAKHIFGAEPTDPEIYDFVLNHFEALRFTAPITLDAFTIQMKRMNPKRMKREVKKQMAKAESVNSHSQEAMRLEIEKNKKEKQYNNHIKAQERKQALFLKKQALKKEKKKGH